MKKIFIVILIFILNIFLVNNLFAAELSPRDTLSKEINSAWNSYMNVYEEWSDKYNDAKARYDQAIKDRDALDKSAADKKAADEEKAAEEKTDPDAEKKEWEEEWVAALWECWIDVEAGDVKIWDALDNCLAWSALVNWEKVKLDWWFWVKIKNWVNNIALYLWVFAVWSIVFWGLMMTLSSWEEEKVKKAKDIIKWGIIWFLWLISASAIINLIVKIMYSL